MQDDTGMHPDPSLSERASLPSATFLKYDNKRVGDNGDDP
jgi:hypothetical protein